MEKGNGNGDSPVTEQQTGSGGAAAGGTPPGPNGGSAPPTGNPPPTAGGGGAQADQSGPRDQPLEIPTDELPPADGYPGYEVGPGATAPAGSSADPGAGTGTQPSDAGGGTPAEQPGGGGGAAAQPPGRDMATQVTEARQRALQSGARTQQFGDGSQVKLDGQGGAEYREGERSVRWTGNDWVDAKSGQAVDRGTWAKADFRLRQMGG